MLEEVYHVADLKRVAEAALNLGDLLEQDILQRLFMRAFYSVLL